MVEDILIKSSKALGITPEELTQKINRGEILVEDLLAKFTDKEIMSYFKITTN